MAFVWVQQWIALPVVLEDQMGDLLPGSASQALDLTAAGVLHEDPHGHVSPSSLNMKSATNSTPFYSQLSSIPQPQIRPDIRSPSHPPIPHYPDHGATAMNMSAMAGALPNYGPIDGTQGGHPVPQQGQRSHLSGASTSALVYQIQQNLQMSGQAPGALPTQSPYGPGYGAGQFQPNFASSQGPQHANYAALPALQRVQAHGQGVYQNFMQPSQYMYYPSAYGPQPQYPPVFPGQNTQSQAIYGRRPSMNSSHSPLHGQNMELPQQDTGFPGSRIAPGNIQGETGTMGNMYSGPFMHAQGFQRSGPSSSIPRGPPRKPKQSGHALWVGNLPPGTTVMALKDHFSRDATKDIESLFLISKSNCAFVNYRTEASCTAAMHRFHDSRFNGVRLVCRLRRSSAPASGVPTGPSAMVGAQPASVSPPQSPQEATTEEPIADSEATTSKSKEEGKPTSTSAEKYFIVKSLTLQDLELSVRNGIWATQSHNENTLNKAFETAENVYLIFSANKSGEYFGYARMASPILENADHLIGSAPKPENITEASDVPKSIPTAATEFAPKGRIIDDSARGTIFWEADLSDSEGEVDEEHGDKDEIPADGDGPAVSQSWGKPFRIEWISTNRLPFYRTRGLRNPWNANREVKIARDGTELEPSVGERLLQMFHRLGPPMMPGPQLGGPPLPHF
ncbi:hypothetical protein P280DRAFT_126255 [Massarina eburnea CBS 473.64]|uniref:YTH domain-containing protein n=1 Tax=Massarina eburnea CBS 473.64 TaxID=1395130 RepID=A0A6A6SCS1_9PLEO|nr:hypothetical protein P280DRAFT_126255 [Massarina eburnea CBS 473.64]